MPTQHVPNFGMWEEQGIEYTKHFENMGKDRSPAFNPNDPEENPEFFMPGLTVDSRPAVSQKHSNGVLSTEAADHGPVHQKPASLPKFGDWDGIDPRSVSYTVVFNEVKEKKHSAAAKLPTATDSTPRNKLAKRRQGTKMLCCIFPVAV
ncbi:hypothetical protein HPP92_011358 [Vanilla planifolia]|uniref:RIN4 pathogenic type III effector avirulence factor Avr cleavage site domain-containing protein n=1 Tax=Vanilla planifolia TaxID=51239 RepID=A0A835R295_VANPL|nr:hypothetical protein HPP92_011652 [Vanilla planifolia]KAG0483274.1 hypothetical protein HPP92_011358 [Vanilla planifolia]